MISTWMCVVVVVEACQVVRSLAVEQFLLVKSPTPNSIATSVISTFRDFRKPAPLSTVQYTHLLMCTNHCSWYVVVT